MKHTLVRAKIHRATVTDGNKNYPGSITIGRNMIAAAGLLPFELVHINNVDTGAHWETYVIPGEDGQIVLNGAPSHHYHRGDIVVIMALADLVPNEVADFFQQVVYVDGWNKVTNVEQKHIKDYL